MTEKNSQNGIEWTHDPVAEFRRVLNQAAVELDLESELAAMMQRAGEIFEAEAGDLERFRETRDGESVVPLTPLDAG